MRFALFAHSQSHGAGDRERFPPSSFTFTCQTYHPRSRPTKSKNTSEGLGSSYCFYHTSHICSPSQRFYDSNVNTYRSSSFAYIQILLLCSRPFDRHSSVTQRNNTFPDKNNKPNNVQRPTFNDQHRKELIRVRILTITVWFFFSLFHHHHGPSHIEQRQAGHDGNVSSRRGIPGCRYPVGWRVTTTSVFLDHGQSSKAVPPSNVRIVIVLLYYG